MRTLLPFAFLVVAAPGCIIRRESLSGGDLDVGVDARALDAADAGDDAGRGDAPDAYALDTSLDVWMNDTTIDAFMPDPDAFIEPDPDAFVEPPDAFVAPPDAFVVPPDAFVVPPDAFAEPPDAFMAAPDAPSCMARTETCNGRDDDCDGVPDNGACRVAGRTCAAFSAAGRVYQYCRVDRNRDAAARECASLGGYTLARIESDAENDVVRSGVMSTVWTQPRDNTTEGSWRFDDRTAATYFHWAMGEPNNLADGPGEDCVVLYASGDWNDARCWSTEHFVCERAIAP